MDFLVCKCSLSGLEVHVPIENLSDERQAVLRAEKIAIVTKEGSKVVLFTREGDAMCGWKVMSGGRVRSLAMDEMQGVCRVDSGSFELAKRQTERLKKASQSQRKCRTED